MNKRLGEAQQGAGLGADAMRVLNLEASKLAELPLDERMLVIAKRFEELNLNAQEQAVLMNQLGSEQGRFFNLLADGGAVIERARTKGGP